MTQNDRMGLGEASLALGKTREQVLRMLVRGELAGGFYRENQRWWVAREAIDRLVTPGDLTTEAPPGEATWNATPPRGNRPTERRA